ncbi:MAG: cytochrome c oxidase assembly protein [Chloroflexota bacterium]|nr:cytochrome c oxidase assembly protein [Chloroflexota bacterium]
MNNEISAIEFFLKWSINSTLFFLLIAAFTIYTIGSYKLINNNKSKGLIIKFLRGFFAYIFLITALLGPFGNFEKTFWVHMIQHLLLIMIVPPLFLSGLFFSANLWFFPRIIRIGLADFIRPKSYFRNFLSKITSPKFTLIFYVISLWTWHLPIFFNYALDFTLVHYFEHISFLISGFLFWWPLIGLNLGSKRISLPLRIVYLLLAVTPTAVVAAFITLSDGVLYGENMPRLFGIEAIEDQKIGGLIMWIPGNTIFLGTLTVLFFKWSDNQTKNSRKYKP